MKKQVHNRPELKMKRKSLRNNGSLIEAIMWNRLKAGQLLGKKFRRQHSVGFYILDFYCPEKKLAVELDGSAHDNPEAQSYDLKRDRFLSDFGIRVLRFQGKEILSNLNGVIEEIEKNLK